MAQIRQTIIVKAELNLDDFFTQNINVPFDVDELRVTQVIFTSPAAANTVEIVVWDKIGEIGSFIHNDFYSSASNSILDVRAVAKSIGGLQTFRIYDVFGAPDTATGQLLIMLEAIKY